RIAIDEDRKVMSRSYHDLNEEMKRAGVLEQHDSARYLKGRSIREMMHVAVWQYKHERELALRKGAELNYEEADKQTRTAPEIKSRMEAEYRKEAALHELHGSDPLTSFDYSIRELNGNARIYHRGRLTEKVILSLPSGFYAYVLIDRERGETN